MENTTNRNDVINFFKDMPKDLQLEAISKIELQLKKPPDEENDSDERQLVSESAGGPIIC